jgi:hypothetical protein
MADIKPTGSETGTAYANMGVSVINSIAGAMLSTRAFEAQIKAETDSKIANMGTIMSNYEYEAVKLKEDFAIMDDMFANKVSERSLQAMKDFATMKAAGAETGTSGGSTDEAIIQAHADSAFDIAIINHKRRVASFGAVKRSEKSNLDAVNALTALASGGTNVESNNLLAGLAGFSSALGGIMSTMPKSVTAELFDFSTNANDVDVMASK